MTNLVCENRVLQPVFGIAHCMLHILRIANAHFAHTFASLCASHCTNGCHTERTGWHKMAISTA